MKQKILQRLPMRLTVGICAVALAQIVTVRVELVRPNPGGSGHNFVG